MKTPEGQIVKTEFDFGWKTRVNLQCADLALRFNRGDILDIGCGTCQYYSYLTKKGWQGRYTGIDITKYEGYEYPSGANLLIGDAIELELPKVNTSILYGVLGVVDDPVALLSKALNTSDNVLVDVPKRNEELWRYGILEGHQVDKDSKHCGFTKEELFKLVERSGGKITNYQERWPMRLIPLHLSRIWLGVVILRGPLAKVLPSKVFYQAIWCEIEPAR